MIKVSVEKNINTSPEAFWALLTNIEGYPGRIKYVKAVDITGPLAVGKEWYDLTTILWLPLRIKHKTAKIVWGKQLDFEVAIPFGGKMYQTVQLTANKEKTRVWGEISFDLGNPLANFLVGPILKARLTDMVTSSLKKVQGGSNED